MYGCKNSYSSQGSREIADYLMQIAGVTHVNLAETQPSSLQPCWWLQSTHIHQVWLETLIAKLECNKGDQKKGLVSNLFYH